MRIIFESLQFLKKLQELRASSVASTIQATLYVPDELMWWKFLEFGTGIRGDNPTSGYTIEPVNARLLHFFNVAVGEEQLRESVFMPGIPAFHMLTLIEQDICDYIKQFTFQALKDSDYNLDTLRQKFLDEAAPKIKDMIIDSYRANLPNHIREFGRMTETAAQAMEDGLEIREGN